MTELLSSVSLEYMQGEFWKKCSACKKPIGFHQTYYICSVSTCNGQRTGYSFCSVPCWDSHVPGARHKDAGALERKAPGSSSAVSAAVEGPRKIIVSSPTTSTSGSTISKPLNIPREVLIVASKLKDYIRLKSEMNTSASVMDVLSDIVRMKCDEAIDRARREGRKTVLDRDFKP
ncbi:MAG: hypothetical protein AB7F59_07660 [Bdellovibrionales bacterium]